MVSFHGNIVTATLEATTSYETTRTAKKNKKKRNENSLHYKRCYYYVVITVNKLNDGTTMFLKKFCELSLVDAF